MLVYTGGGRGIGLMFVSSLGGEHDCAV